MHSIHSIKWTKVINLNVLILFIYLITPTTNTQWPISSSTCIGVYFSIVSNAILWLPTNHLVFESLSNICVLYSGGNFSGEQQRSRGIWYKETAILFYSTDIYSAEINRRVILNQLFPTQTKKYH